MPPTRNGQEVSPAFLTALDALAAALESKHVETICTAYLALRRAGQGLVVGQLLGRISAACGELATGAIVSAFSHRKCFMCEDGTTACETCEGVGTVDRFPCPQCRGLGVEPCSFCLGAGWGDPNDVPEEIRRAVLARQTAHVQRDTQRLSNFNGQAAQAARLVPAPKRQELAAWLIRLQARLMRLAGAETGEGSQQDAHASSTSARIDSVLQALRPQAQTEGPSREDSQ